MKSLRRPYHVYSFDEELKIVSAENIVAIVKTPIYDFFEAQILFSWKVGKPDKYYFYEGCSEDLKIRIRHILRGRAKLKPVKEKLFKRKNLEGNLYRRPIKSLLRKWYDYNNTMMYGWEDETGFHSRLVKPWIELYDGNLIRFEPDKKTGKVDPELPTMYNINGEDYYLISLRLTRSPALVQEKNH